MSIDTHTLIWLFPVAFMFHDFEEILFWELWLRKNGSEIKSRLPAFLSKQAETIMEKSTAQFSFPVLLIFSLTALSSFLAVEYESYGFFLMASGAFPAWFHAHRSGDCLAKVCPCRDHFPIDRYSIWTGFIWKIDRRRNHQCTGAACLLPVCCSSDPSSHTDHA
jgi:hypothetical protein